MQKSENRLPILRHDLEIYKGPDASDGMPTYNIYDPVEDNYYKITWVEATICQILQPGMTAEQLIHLVNTKTTLRIRPEDVEEFFKLADRCKLTQQIKSSEELEEESEKKKTGALKWFFSHYLYFRIPLIKPHRFLKNTLHFATPFASRIAMVLYGLIGFFGVMTLLLHFETYVNTFTYFFNVRGVLFYLGAILFVKLIHEFAHAYTATYYGVKVNRMGIAFIVFIPVLFTDVTHGWRLQNRKHRFAISAAGVFSELILAAIATLLWSFQPQGIFKSIFFVVSSVSLITSLLFNLNPALRYDGYYMLSDLWGIDNLQMRAFVVTRWKLRDWLLGLVTPPPEKNLSQTRVIGYVAYSLFTWAYRVFVFMAISLLVYYYFTKVIGVILLTSTVFLIIILPILNEARRLVMLREYIHQNPRLTTTLFLLGLFVFWVAFPLPHSVTFTGISVPKEQQVVYVPYNGKVSKIHVQRGETVQPGMKLLELTSEVLDTQIKTTELAIDSINEEISVLTLSKNFQVRSKIPGKSEELISKQEQLQSLQAAKEKMLIHSNVNGVVHTWDQNLWIGQPLKTDYEVGKIAPSGKFIIRGYLPESHINDVEKGQSATFTVKSTLKSYTGTVTSVRAVGSQFLIDEQLASTFGGDIPVIPDAKNRPVLAETYYLVEVQLDGSQEGLRGGETGWISARGRWKSYLVEAINSIKSLFIRESGV